VLENLYSFLQEVARHFPRILLWIDAISINQEDATEKGEQVTRMADVYSGAIETLVWLGDKPRLNTATFPINHSRQMPAVRDILYPLVELHSDPYWSKLHFLLLRGSLTAASSGKSSLRRRYSGIQHKAGGNCPNGANLERASREEFWRVSGDCKFQQHWLSIWASVILHSIAKSIFRVDAVYSQLVTKINSTDFASVSLAPLELASRS